MSFTALPRSLIKPLALLAEHQLQRYMLRDAAPCHVPSIAAAWGTCPNTGAVEACISMLQPTRDSVHAEQRSLTQAA